MRKFDLTIKTDYFCELDLDGFPYTVLKKNEEQVIEVSEGKHTVKLTWTTNRSIFIEREIDVHENVLFEFNFEDYLLASPEILKTESDFLNCLYSFPRFKAIWDSFDSFDITGDLDLGDVISVSKDGRKLFVDRLGKEVLDKYYVIREGDKYGFAHGWDRVIIPPTYCLPVRDALENEPDIYNPRLLEDGIGLVHQGNKWGFIDLKKDNPEPLLFDMIKTQQDCRYSETDLPVMNDGMWGIYSTQKRNQVVPCSYERIYRKDGEIFYTYESSGKSGIINLEGEVVIEATYDERESFRDGIAFAKQGDKWGVIDTNGNQLYPFELDLPGITSYGYSFLVRNGKCGVMDNLGGIIIPIEYDMIRTNEGAPFWFDDWVDEDTGDIIPIMRSCPIKRRFEYFITEKDGLLGVMNLHGEECDMNDLPEPVSMASSDTAVVTIIPLSPDFSIVHKKEGWRLCKSDGEYLDDIIYDDCAVCYGKVSVMKNGLYREIRRSDAKLVGNPMKYPLRYGDDNGVGTPVQWYEGAIEMENDCYWIEEHDMAIDCYGNIIWERPPKFGV